MKNSLITCRVNIERGVILVVGEGQITITPENNSRERNLMVKPSLVIIHNIEAWFDLLLGLWTSGDLDCRCLSLEG